MITTETLAPVTLFVPKGAASFVNIYTPNPSFEDHGVVKYTLSVPFDHPDCLMHMLPFPPKVSKSGYVTFKSNFAPEVEVRPSSYKWLVDTIAENKARNKRDTFLFEDHDLELELAPYHWKFRNDRGTSYGLNRVTILRDRSGEDVA